MKRIAALLFATVLLLALPACTDKKSGQKPTNPSTSGPTDVPAPGPNFPDAPILILNGEKLDVYTSHYGVTEEYAVIPLTAFLMSVGADYADSPLNEYGIQCYSFMGKRYIEVDYMHLFMFEDDYKTLLKELKDEGKELSQETVADCGLLP